MSKLWQCLESIRGLVAAPMTWHRWLGDEFDIVKSTFLRSGTKPAKSIPCSRECGCAHEVIRQTGGRLVAVCRCESWTCEDIPITAADLTPLSLNGAKLGRAIATAFGCDAKEAALGLPNTWQVASFSGVAIPVILTIQSDRHEFRNVVNEVVARMREHFVLLSPTGQFHDAYTHGLLKGAKSGFFDLESQLTVLPSGLLQARASGSELFSPFLPSAMEPASDDEARRLFALLKSLDEETNVRKAPVVQVFRLYCLEGLSRRKVANRCGCAESLVTLRLRAIEKHLGRKPTELRTLSAQFERIEDSLTDPRARHIHRKSAIDDGRLGEND